jgi:hypothetical protein
MNSKVLLIIGAAPCTGEDIMRFFDIKEARNGVDYMLIGYDSVELVSEWCKYFATYHPNEIQMSKDRRHKYGGNTDFLVISHQQHQGEVDMIVPIVGPSGSSAMLGALAGLQLGYSRITLCGCPLNGSNTKGDNYETFRQGFEYAGNKKQIMGKVKSLSGWTADFLGTPTEEWLDA